MPTDKSTVPEAIVRYVKAQLTRMFDESHSLRAYYLLCRKNNYSWPPFSPEDLAQFIIWLLLNNFRGAADVPPLSEIIIKYLIGDVEGGTNAIAEAVRYNFFADQAISQRTSFDEYYYLEFLPSRKLFHLTNSSEKSRAAMLYSTKLSNIAERQYFFEDSTDNADTLRPLANFKNSEATSLFASMQRLSPAKDFSFSVTICGLYKSMIGLGEDARRLFDMLTELGLRVELFDCSPSTLERDPTADFYETFETSAPCSKVMIFCMPLFEMARILPKLTSNFFSNRYVIGYWPWELSAYPTGWREIIDLADEVWASSRFLENVYSEACSRPVYYIPLCVETTADSSNELSSKLIQPNAVSFLTIFDFNSSATRKNPSGSVKAFKKAFSKRDYGAKLVIKSLHGNLNYPEMQNLIEDIDKDPRISFFDGPATKADLNGLIASSSALLSLHRSEGFGRLPAEAMLLKTPVIATDWSGSSDFINRETAFPVAYCLREVGIHEYPYAAGMWAEPDLDDAARVLKQFCAEKVNHARVVEAAYSHVQSSFSRKAVKDLIFLRMNEIDTNFSECDTR